LVLYLQLVTLESEVHAEDATEEAKALHILPFIKPLSKLIFENNDITKLVSQLSSIITANRHDVADLLNSFTGFEELWKSVSLFNLLAKFGFNNAFEELWKSVSLFNYARY